MEEKNKNKSLIWIIITIIVLVLGIIGYVVYDNFLNVDKTNPNYDNTTTTTSKTTTTTNYEDENDIGMFEILEKNTSFPNANDNNVISLELGLDNEVLLKTYSTKQAYIEKQENYDVRYMCTEVGEYFGKTEGCLTKTVEFNGILIDTTDETLTCGHSEYYLYKDYIIVLNIHGCNAGCYYDLSIYNLITKKELFKTEKAMMYDLKIIKDKIYYMTINKELKFNDDKEANYVEYGYNYYDLNNKQNINIKNFEGEYNPQI